MRCWNPLLVEYTIGEHPNLITRKPIGYRKLCSVIYFKILCQSSLLYLIDKKKIELCFPAIQKAKVLEDGKV